jgi:hypothetical protein
MRGAANRLAVLLALVASSACGQAGATLDGNDTRLPTPTE